MVWNEGRATHDSTVNKIRVQEIIITFKVHEKKSMNCILYRSIQLYGSKICSRCLHSHWNGNVILAKFHHWLQRKFLKWQLSVQPVAKISSKWRQFCLGVELYISGGTKYDKIYILLYSQNHVCTCVNIAVRINHSIVDVTYMYIALNSNTRKHIYW